VFALIQANICIKASEDRTYVSSFLWSAKGIRIRLSGDKVGRIDDRDTCF
jgi:hypothetical protein